MRWIQEAASALVLGLLILVQGLASAAEFGLPTGTWSCHGTAILRGQGAPERFWLRLLPPEPSFGGHRVLQVVYSPPPPQALGGTHLADVPFLLLDDQARIVAWNERSGLSQAAPGSTAAATWVVTLDRTPENHTELVSQQRQVPGPRADLPLVDLFGDQAPARCTWNGTAVNLDQEALTVEPDADGRLKRLIDAKGTPLVVVQDWLSSGT